MLDMQIRNGSIIDGTGNPRRQAHLGIKDGRIVSIDQTEVEAAQIIDAAGKIVAPGFVDIHTHFDAPGILGSDPQPFTPSWSDQRGWRQLRLHHRSAGAGRQLQAGLRWRVSDANAGAGGRHAAGTAARRSALGLDVIWRVSEPHGRHPVYQRGFHGRPFRHQAVVMGEDSTKREATPEELEAQANLLRDGIEAGGWAFRLPGRAPTTMRTEPWCPRATPTVMSLWRWPKSAANLTALRWS